ncbi:MAG: hypothetical protein IJM62_07050 [Lachnospiraceae bacterium]|nr:hypothetical protein [Lachnospiraceae bacterium]
MKKVFALMMVFVLSFAALTGCKKSSSGGETPAETQSQTTAPESQSQTTAPESQSQTTAPETQSQTSSKTPFNETAMYKNIVDLVDKNFASYDHLVTYDTTNEALFLIFEAPANTRKGLESRNSSVMEAWQKVVDGFSNLSKTFYDSLHSTYGVEHVYVYMVEEMKSGGGYVADDIFLYVDNGEVKVNVGK